MKKKILVILPVEECHKQKLEAAAKGCAFTYATQKTVTKEMVDEANIIIGNAPASMIAASDRLELLQLNSAGADAYILPGVLSNKTILTNATGAYGQAVAEHCFIAALTIQKKLELYRDHQKKHEWVDEGMVTSIANATVLVVGMGDIGTHFATLAKKLGAPRVIGMKRRASEKPDCLDELYLTEQLDELLPQADIIASFLPGTAATKHIYTRERFEKMKSSAIFVNGGRGNAVSSDTLYEALTEGMIAGAAIDVTDPEPLPAESPLWDVPNLLITPHISGKYHLKETFERIIDIACGNMKAYLEGGEIRNIVDFETGYKK